MYRKFLRPGWIVGHLMVALAVLVCLRLGWWQWHRTHEADGTIQNLGYAILWPVFGAAFIYMWFRFLQLELVKDAEDDAELTELAAGDPITAEASSGPVRPQDPDPVERGIELDDWARTDPTAGDVGSQPAAEVIDESRPAQAAADAADDADVAAVDAALLITGRTPSRGYTVAVSAVGDDDDDPELAAYNRALAALAEKDHRRAR